MEFKVYQASIVLNDYHKHATNVLAEYETVSGNPVLIPFAVGSEVKNLLIDCGIQQAGTGVPTPNNLRPITKYTEISVYVSGADTSNPTITTQQLTTPMCSGFFNFLTGDGMTDSVLIELDGSENWGSTAGGTVYYMSASGFGHLVTNDPPISNYLRGIVPGSSSSLNYWETRLNTSKTNLLVKPDSADIDTVTKWKNYLTANPLQILFKRNTDYPFTEQGNSVSTVDGVNNIWTNGTNLTVEYQSY